jgi:hypothetical protein
VTPHKERSIKERTIPPPAVSETSARRVDDPPVKDRTVPPAAVSNPAAKRERTVAQVAYVETRPLPSEPQMAELVEEGTPSSPLQVRARRSRSVAPVRPPSPPPRPPPVEDEEHPLSAEDEAVLEAAFAAVALMHGESIAAELPRPADADQEAPQPFVAPPSFFAPPHDHLDEPTQSMDRVRRPERTEIERPEDPSARPRVRHDEVTHPFIDRRTKPGFVGERPDDDLDEPTLAEPRPDLTKYRPD